MLQFPQSPAPTGQLPNQFDFQPTASADANGFLQRAADHLKTLSPPQRRDWFADWIPVMQRAKITPGMTAFDKSQVILTLERWNTPGEATAVAA